MKAPIEQNDCFKARVNYYRTDDLKEDVAKNGNIVMVKALWIAEKDENFAGDWIFEVLGFNHHIPARELEFITSIPEVDYDKVKSIFYGVGMFRFDLYFKE